LVEARGHLFGRNIRFLRRAVGLVVRGEGFSQRDLAVALDVTRRSVISWESGNIPNANNLKKIANFFGESLGVEITPSELVETDLSVVSELLPLSDFERGLSPESRRIFHSLFLSTRGLGEEELKKVIEYVRNLKKT